MHWWRLGSRSRPAADEGVAPGGAAGALVADSDDVVQQLTVAKYALASGDQRTATAALDAALTTSRRVLTSLMQDEAAGSGQSRLVRSNAATVIRPDGAAGLPHPRH